MGWLTKISQLNPQQIRDEFSRRYFDASRKSRQISESMPRNATDYFQSVVEDAQIRRASQQPWNELYLWMQSIIPMVNQTNDKEFIDIFMADLEHFKQEATRVHAEPDPKEYEDYYDEEVVEFYLDVDNLTGLLQLLDKHNIPYDTHESPTGQQVMTIEMGREKNHWGRSFPVIWVVEINNNQLQYWKSVEDWINDVHEDAERYFGEQDTSAEFWDGVGPGFYLYHATNEENVESIMKNGLQARYDTRGIYNKGMGDAVFTITGENSDDIHAALESYGTAVIRIDAGAMKADGFTPPVERETPVQEADVKDALANLIGADTYEAERESDYMDDTIAIYSTIPPKYLTVLGV